MHHPELTVYVEIRDYAAYVHAQPQPAPAKEQKPHVPRQVPEKRVIDTRGGGNVNLGKYDERFDRLAGAHAGENVKRGKEKFQNKQKQRQQQAAASAKRRAEERERMQKLQFEIAKKAQLKVQIPDAIGVGELASRMKKTGAEVVRALIKNGVMASLSDIIDYDTAALVAMELGCKVEREVVVTVEERLIDDSEDKPEDLVPRARSWSSWARRPRQDQPARLYPQGQRGRGRGRRHHPAHRRLHRQCQGQPRHLPRHAGP